MLFLNSTFCGGAHTLDQTAVSGINNNQVSIQNGVFDMLYAEKTAYKNWGGETDIPWSFNTILSAHFKGDLKAGNVDWSLSTINAFRLKRRRKGKSIFETIKKFDVSTIDDFNIEYNDYTAGIGVYEYALVPCLNNIEGNMDIGEVESNFEGAFLIDAFNHYSIQLDVKLDYHRVKNGASLNTLGRKFPIYVSNGKNDYDTGSLTGAIVQKDGCNFKFEDFWNYRNQFYKFVTNGSPKLLKNQYGEMWIVNILTHEMSEDHSKHPLLVDTTISWDQCGDAEDILDLYRAGLIDYSPYYYGGE